MSKSLGNFLTIDDMLKNYDANTLRLFILTNHYRMPVEFSDEALSSAKAGAKRLTNAKQAPINENLDITTTEEYKAFIEAMDEDLNTSKALAILFDLATRANKDEKDAYTILYKLGTVLGFTFEKAGVSEEDIKNGIAKVSETLGQDFSSIEEILELRKQARTDKNWDIADKIRIALDKSGIVLKDTKDGTVIESK
jgi:cysteinyl-tRNA synthetase